VTVKERVPDADMPQLFQAANEASLAGQGAYIDVTRWRLVLLAGAATAGVTSWRVGRGDVDLLGLVSMLSFITAVVLEGWLWKERPDKAWYDGRAVAESAKTLAWKFAVAGGPFPSDVPLDAAKRMLLDLLEGVRDQFGELELHPNPASQISSWMVHQRLAPFADRKQQYIVGRIREQKSWYAEKARSNKRRSKQWRFITVGLELAGAVASLAQALLDMGILLDPAMAALGGAAVAWVNTKQHDALGRAYSAAVADLSTAEERLELVRGEADWASEVDDAEEAISREHTVWLASRSRR